MLAWPAHAASQRDRDDCNQTSDADRSIAGCTRVLQDSKESPRNRAFAYNSRGAAYAAKGDNDRAIADISEAIRLDPKYAFVYRNRGIVYLYGGSLAKAQADFKQAAELDPKDAYAAVWLDIAERRNGLPSHLAQTVKQLEMTR